MQGEMVREGGWEERSRYRGERGISRREWIALESIRGYNYPKHYGITFSSLRQRELYDVSRKQLNL